MYARIWPTLNNLKRRFEPAVKASSGYLGLGLFLGVVSVSMWQQWSLTFGLDAHLLLAVSIVISIGCWFGSRQATSEPAEAQRSLSASIICLACWSLLHPFWVETLTVLVGKVPLAYLEMTVTKSLVCLLLAALAWLIPAMLWSGVVAKGMAVATTHLLPIRTRLSLVLIGAAYGLMLNALVLSPQFGVFTATIIVVVLAIAAALWLRRAIFTHDTVAATTSADVSTHNILPPVRTAMALVLGALLACHLRLANQLMPHAAYVMYAQFAGVLFGFTGAFFLLSRANARTGTAPWAALIAAATSSLLLALQPRLVDLSLQMNSSLSSTILLLSGRVTLMMLIAAPFGLALTWVADDGNDKFDGAILRWASPFTVGLGAATFLLGSGVGLIPAIGMCVTLLLVFAATLQIQAHGFRVSIRNAIAMGGLIAIAMSLPLWRLNDDASRTAKLLFSTPTFLAYRCGWDIEHLPHLDDVRMIDRLEGTSGPLTLWRGKVAELYVREAGIPRAVVSKNSNAVPQFPPEVLQAVYSLVLADRPSRVMFLGLSAGVPLSTCLTFPIREAVCVEGDSHRIDLIQGPLARETGFNPLSDERVTLKRVNPELALMAEPLEPFDVILSSPASSSMTDGAAYYTEEYFQRASHQLNERGLFCQRLECVDYGIEPIRLIVKAMRSAFRRVIAVEPTGGEFLLFAANSDDVFIPGELATRLEARHVCKALARSGLDWSALLNMPAYDHAVLAEICDESSQSGNSCRQGRLAAIAPLEVMRWGNKLQEVQNVLTAKRTSEIPFWTDSRSTLGSTDDQSQSSRRTRLVEWLGDSHVSQELLRRVGEVASQQKLVRENPDAHWWAYRNVLKKQLQERPRTAVQLVKAMDEKPTMHPEDVRRRDYFVALGAAARNQKPTREQIAEVEEFLEPYDPLVSYFARQETADLLARCGEDAATELAYRLYVIYFVPTTDASVRNVATAIETLVAHPDTIADDSTRFDALNGLIQTLRIRWEIRQSFPDVSPYKMVNDIDQSLLAIEKSVTVLAEISSSAGVPANEWKTRKDVIDRLMLRPLRAYRTLVQSKNTRGQAEAKAIIDQATLSVDGE